MNMTRASLAILLMPLLLAAPALAQAGKTPAQAVRLSPEQAADRLVWIDEHARWNAEHMAAARRLEAVVAALRQHNTGFDLHGQELRDHGTTPSSESLPVTHTRLRTAHEQARNVHDDLMDAVDVLTRILRKNLGKTQSFPAARRDAED
jgi:hypothetical protein